MAVGEKELDTIQQEHTLLRGEALLVVAAGDAEDVALPFIAQQVTGHFLCDFLVVEDAAGKVNQLVLCICNPDRLYRRFFSSRSN